MLTLELLQLALYLLFWKAHPCHDAYEWLRLALVQPGILRQQLLYADVREGHYNNIAGAVRLNDDDDEVVDKDDASVAGEDDLITITLQQMLPAGLPGTHKVSICWTLASDAKIDVFEGSDKSTPVSSFAEYELNTLPKTLYVEGDLVSESVRDVELTLFYILDEQPRSEDKVRVTVVQIDLSAQDLDGTVSEADEEDPAPHDKDKGAFVHCNVDNDNNSDNEIGAPKQPGADYYEHYNDPVTGEDDLKSAVITLQPASLQTGKVVLERKNSILWVWTDPEKGPDEKLLIESDTKTWDLSDSEQRTDFNNIKDDLWVEGFDDIYSTLTVQFKDPNDEIIYEDKVDYKFICAKCGNQPTTHPEDRRGDFESAFPNLIHCEWSITAGASGVYNCIAFSAGITDAWLEKLLAVPNPSPPPPYIYYEEYWLGGVHYYSVDKHWGDKSDTWELDDMDALYNAALGLSPDASGPSDAEVMYYDGFHAAKKKGCSCGAGRWDDLMFESKCGPAERIEHVYDQLDDTLDPPYGPGYGDRVRYYK